jgi:hypothetical protein
VSAFEKRPPTLQEHRPRRLLVHLNSPATASDLIATAKQLRRCDDSFIATSVYINPKQRLPTNIVSENEMPSKTNVKAEILLKQSSLKVLAFNSTLMKSIREKPMIIKQFNSPWLHLLFNAA